MRGILYSVALHTLVVLTVALGLPWLTNPPAIAARSIAVDIVRLSDITQATKGEKPKPETERKPDAERETTKNPVARDRSAEKPPDEPKLDEPKPVKPEPVVTKLPKAAEPEPKPRPEPAPPEKTAIAKPEAAPPAPPKPAKKAEPAPKPQAEPPKRAEIDPGALQRQTAKPKKPALAKKPEPPEPKPAPKPAAKPVEKPEKKPETRVARPAPKPEQPKTAPKKPAKPEKTVAIPKQKPQQKPPKPATKTAPEIERQIAALPRIRPQAPRPRKDAKPPRKAVKKPPAKEDPLDSVFKTVGKLKKSAQSDRDRTSARTPEGVKTAARSLPMTLSEIEAVRRQIRPCWNFPAGAQDAGSLRVLIRIWLNRDGSVRDAKVLDQARLAGNAKLRASADAGLRAVNNPRCSPLRLPPEKFDQWKVLTIDFDPSKLKSG